MQTNFFKNPLKKCDADNSILQVKKNTQHHASYLKTFGTYFGDRDSQDEKCQIK